MNDIEIYGMKVNDIKDVREVLTVLWAIQEKQDELVRLQGEVADGLRKKIDNVSSILKQLSTTAEAIEEININFNKLVEALKTINENIAHTYESVEEVKKEVNNIKDTVAEKTRDEISIALSEIETEARKQFETASKKVADQFQAEFQKLSQEVEKISATTRRVSKILNVKILIVNIVIGLMIGLASGFAVLHADQLAGFISFWSSLLSK